MTTFTRTFLLLVVTGLLAYIQWLPWAIGLVPFVVAVAALLAASYLVAYIVDLYVDGRRWRRDRERSTVIVGFRPTSGPGRGKRAA